MTIIGKLICIVIVAVAVIFGTSYVLDYLAQRGVNEQEPQVVIVLFMFLVFFGSSWAIMTSD